MTHINTSLAHYFYALSIILCNAEVVGAQYETHSGGKLSAVLEDSLDRGRKSPVGAMFRSAILPGWGQAYNGKYIKAFLYLGAEVYLIRDYRRLDEEMNDLPDGRERDNVEDRRNLRAWWFGLGYFLNIGDAFVDAHLYEFENGDEIVLNIEPDPESGSINFGVNLVF